MLDPIENKLIRNKQLLYSLDDVCIIPTGVSKVRHRSECNPLHDNQMLPIFAAPMSTVVADWNYEYFRSLGVIPILPRNIDFKTRKQRFIEGYWVAVSLDEFERMTTKDFLVSIKVMSYTNKYHILVDIANGHMEALHNAIFVAKQNCLSCGVDVEVMAGNVASPEAFQALCEAGADMVRCSVGSGSLCSTSVQTGIHYPLASLIDKCFKIKEQNGYKTAIIADGGINSYDRAIKALALGADYVMIGTAFGKAFESAAEYRVNDNWFTRLFNGGSPEWKMINLHYDLEKVKEYVRKHKLTKVIFGMSTRNAQRQIDPNAKKLKTSEGVVRTVNVEYTLQQWVENFKDYLKSAMSYTGFTDLEHFIGGPEIGIMTPLARNVYMK